MLSWQLLADLNAANALTKGSPIPEGRGMPTTTDTSTAVQFGDVKVGDMLTFQRRDTGFGGDGIVDRSGEVVKVTARTVVVEARHYSTATRYVLRASDWYSAAPRRVTA